jgi:hypothetical protein
MRTKQLPLLVLWTTTSQVAGQQQDSKDQNVLVVCRSVVQSAGLQAHSRETALMLSPGQYSKSMLHPYQRVNNYTTPQRVKPQCTAV